MIHGGAFREVAAILLCATGLGLLGRWMRQPLIIAFLAAGILAGPSGLGIISGYEQIELLAHMGVALLLFIVGLRLDLHLIRTVGRVAVATGLGQMVFTWLLGFAIAKAVGMDPVSAAYASSALTFSSTIIIVKLLSDKREIDSLHGQIALGFLLVQDIAAVLALVALTTLGAATSPGQSVALQVVRVASRAVGMLAAVGVLMRYAIPRLSRRIASSPEILTLFAIAWAVTLGAVSDWLGFSREVGSFIAGISLASSEYRDALGARLTTLRDFLLLFFFVELGARLDVASVGPGVGTGLLLSVFVLVGNPLIVTSIMGAMGYRRRTSFLAGLTVAQISEFSLILVSVGLAQGHISRETVGLVTSVGVITIFVSTYMILYSSHLYRWLSPVLRVFERRNPYREASMDAVQESSPVDVILIGLGAYGGTIAECLMRRNRLVVGVDFDPRVVDRWRTRGLRVVYGDANDPDLFHYVPLGVTRWVVSTIRSRELNMAVVQHLRQWGYGGRLALTAVNQAEARDFQKAGAHLVFLPLADAAEQAVDALTYAMELLPREVDWPITFAEIRIRSDASVAGKTLRSIPLSSVGGVSVLAVSRGGRVHYDPGPDFQIYPGDRIIIVGPPHGVHEAEAMLTHPESGMEAQDPDRFEIAEVPVGEHSPMAGMALRDLGLRQTYRVTVVGIRRGDERITAVKPEERIMAGDRLVVIGTARAVADLRRVQPL